MGSDASQRRANEIKARGQRKRMGTVAEPGAPATAPPPLVCTGDLADAEKCFKDIKIENLNLSFKGEDIITNSTLNLTYGSFYGVVPSSASDGCTFFKAMAEGLLPFPSHFEVSYPLYNPDRGHLSVREYVASREDVTEQIEAQQAKLAIHAGNSEAMRLLNKRLKAFRKYDKEYAAQILYGLGFDKEMQSGTADGLPSSWQKPLALARTLHIRPQIMLIDEPTHFLDLEASLWLAKYILENLKEKCIVIIKSNDEGFLRELCTQFLHLKDGELQQFDGSYDQFVLAKAVIPSANFMFTEPLNRNIAPPYLQLADASFRYDDSQNLVFEKVELDVTLSSRIALVGSKGSGKSTLLNILRGANNLTLTEGRFTSNPNLSIGYFHRQLIEELDLSISPIKHISSVLQGQRNITSEVTGLQQKEMRKPIRNLSHGQKTLLVLACLSLKHHDILLLDEPCENLDVETIASIGTALNKWNGSFVLATSNLALINMLSCDVWVCGSKGLVKYPADIMQFKQKMQDHNSKMANIRDPANIRSSSTYPQIAISNFADVAHPSVHYEEYVDDFTQRFKSGCLPFADFIDNMPMVANAPCSGINGDMDFPYETVLTKTYRMTTDPGRRIGRSLFGAIHVAEEAGECFGDFDSTNLVVSSNGTVRLKNVKRKRLCLNQLRRNHLSARKIVMDMCSAGGAVPEDVQHLLDMVEKEPDLAPLYHIHYSLIPICAISPVYTKMFEQLLRYIKDPVLVDQILLEMPYLGTDLELINGQGSGPWHKHGNSNDIIKKTYNHRPGLFNLPPLQAPFNMAITPQQIRERKLLEARHLLNCLRNRVAHRMDYNNGVMKYTGRASDLAAHARFSKVGCVLQKELHKAKQTGKLDLHEFSLEIV